MSENLQVTVLSPQKDVGKNKLTSLGLRAPPLSVA